MQKATLVFLISSSLSLAAAANNELNTAPGDPKKEKDKKASYELAEGYFSIFSVFLPAPAPTDTTKTRPVPPVSRKVEGK